MFDLSDILTSLNKEFGDGSITIASKLKPREYRSSGSIAVDLALGGGYGKSTIVDVIGKQSAGKTLLFELAAVTAQKVENKPSCIFDFEGTFDPSRFILLGGDLSGLTLIRAENFSDKVGPLFMDWAADMMKAILTTGRFACIANDSTAAMVSKAEYNIKEEKGEEAATMAYTARGMSSILRQIVGTGILARSGTTVFYMSQMRDNIGGRSFGGRPIPDKRTGGRALPFYAATQLEISRGDTFTADVDVSGVMAKDAEVGHETKVRVRKNKLNGKQGRVASFDLYSEGEVRGLDAVGELARLCVLTGVVEKGGTWYSFPNGERVQGKDAVEEQLANPDVFESIYALTRARLELSMQEHALPEEVIEGEEPDFDPDIALMSKYG
jgi:recombination protein RecA